MKFRLIEEKENKKTLDLDEALGLKESKNKVYKLVQDASDKLVVYADILDIQEAYRKITHKRKSISYDEFIGLGTSLYDAIIKQIQKDQIETYGDTIIGKNPYEESLQEDTIKQNGKWVNKGKEGTHGTFKTKKEADAQRKAMFANSGKNRDFGEALYGKNEIADFFDKAKRLGVETLGQLKDLLNQEESKGNTEKEKIDAYADSVELGDDTLSNESLKEDLNKKSLEQEIRKAVREHFKTWDDEDYEDMIGEYLVVEVEDQEDGRTKVEVRAELSYATLDNIADELNKIVQKYDKDAYFDHEDAGIINAFIDKNAQGKVIDEYGASKDEKLQSVRLRDYRNTWSAIDHMEVNGVDYYMFENDIFGDETYYVVTTNINNGPFYETFDDIETCLRDEGILEESLTEGVNKKSLKKEVKDWARDDYENGVVLDIDDTAEFEKLLLDDHPDLKNRKDMPDLIYELKDLYFDTVDDLRSGDYDELDEKLIQGKSDATLKKNIKTEIEAGKDPKQAYAIAKSIQKKNESFEDEHLGEAIKDDEIVDYFDNSVHDEDIVEDDFDEEHIEELTKKAIEESKKHTKEVGTTITENKPIDTPTQEIINESVNSNEEVAIDYISPNAVDANFQAQEVDLNNI